ncbi:hypothetical protein MRX96_001085 [Rhipicephalus microplus]
MMAPVLWYEKEHPDMTLVLQAFVRQLEELNKTCLRWEYAGTVVKSMLLNSSSDLIPPVDRVWVLELTSFGGLLFALAKNDTNEFSSSVCTPM